MPDTLSLPRIDAALLNELMEKVSEFGSTGTAAWTARS